MPELRRAAGLTTLVPAAASSTEARLDGSSSAAAHSSALEDCTTPGNDKTTTAKYLENGHGADASHAEDGLRNDGNCGDQRDPLGGSEIGNHNKISTDNRDGDGSSSIGNKQTEPNVSSHPEDASDNKPTGEVAAPGDSTAASSAKASQQNPSTAEPEQPVEEELVPKKSLLSLASAVLTSTRLANAGGGETRIKATETTAAADRTRREEARRSAELYKAFPMAGAWGGLSLAVLLKNGLLDKRGEIGSISAEATASAVLSKTLKVIMKSYRA